MIDPTTIDRYQGPNGDIYLKLVAEYGQGNANAIAAAAKTGDRVNVDNAIEAARNRPKTNSGYWSNLLGQFYNDPFGAPIEQAGNVAGATATDIGNAAKSVVAKSAGNWGVWLVGGVLVIAGLLYIGGGKWAGKKIFA